MDRHRLKQLRDKVGELHRFGSPSSMSEASSIMRDEFDSVLAFALELTEPKPKPKHSIADNYPAGGLTATEPCMFCEDYAKVEQQRDDLLAACEKLMTCVLSSCGDCDIKCPDNENIAMTLAEAAIAKTKPT